MRNSHSVSAQLAREVAAHRLEFDAAQQAAALRLDDLALALNRAPQRFKLWRRATPAAPRGLYLWGNVGRGKTHLMDLFYGSLQFTERERSHFYRFMRTIHAELREAGNTEQPLEIVAARLAARARVICLDEFMVTDIADAMILGGLLEGLLRRAVTIVATSNRAPQDLYHDGLQRQRFMPAIQLLQRELDVVALGEGTDYRLRQLERARTYLDSNAPGSEAEMQDLFQSLAQDSRTGPTDLPIEGRIIGARDTGAGVAWFDFQTLCEGARAASDYLELARLYQTIFVSNVPIFDSLRDDAARRFLMLVDALYDCRAGLVVAAAAPPAELYRGERLRFEFQRAVSRLIEMQSQRYLGRLPRD
jgi:cell division protein ZapE